MTTPNRSRPNEAAFGPEGGAQSVTTPCTKLPESIGRKRLEDLHCDLTEGDNHWPDYMAATIDEDYRQLLKDLEVAL
jgi:hypothetical protein